MNDLTLEDLESALYAMASWLDAFEEEDDQAEEAVRIRRVHDTMARWIAAAQEQGFRPSKDRHLKLVEPPKEES